MARPCVETAVVVWETNGRRRPAIDVGHVLPTVSRGLVGNRARLARLGATVAVILAAVLLHWGAGAVCLLGLLAASVSGLIDGRVSVAVGLLCIASCPVLLLAEQYAWLQQSSLVTYYMASVGVYTLQGAADEVAVWAYYFLCIGVAAQIVRYGVREKRCPGD